MTCRELQDLLLEHKAGALPLRLHAAFTVHAAICSCCRALVKTYGTTVEVSHTLADVEVPEVVVREVERILAELQVAPLDAD
jgi:hypothetical protein